MKYNKIDNPGGRKPKSCGSRPCSLTLNVYSVPLSYQIKREREREEEKEKRRKMCYFVKMVAFVFK